MNKFFAAFLIGIILSMPIASAQLPYDYTSTKSVPIELSPKNEISTKHPVVDGSVIEFLVVKDVFVGSEKILSKGDEVKGTVEMMVTSGMNGFPAEIIVDRFEVTGLKISKIDGYYVKTGQNRCVWVYPLKWGLTIIPFVGSLTNLIKGGHARLKTTDVITIYYYPEWK